MRIPGTEDHNRAAIENLIRQLAADGRGGAALGEAARWGRKDLLEELLACGLAVDARSETGATPLMLAASAGRTEIVPFLIERGADVNAVDESHGKTPLIWTLSAFHSQRVYLAVCKAILNAGASLTPQDEAGRTALDWARERRVQEVVLLLEKHQLPTSG